MICSNHFIGNKRSNDPRSSSSIPSIFPNIYKKNDTNSKQSDDRYKRKLCRDIQKTSLPEQQPLDLVENINVTQFITVSTQVILNDSNSQNFIFSFTYDGNNVSTQACIPFFSNCVDIINKPNSSDKSCGVDSLKSLSCLSCEAFHGFESIKNETCLKDITGITYPMFDILIKLMLNSNCSLLSNENK